MSDSEKPSSDQVELPTEERKNLLVPDVQRWRKEDGPIISLNDPLPGSSRDLAGGEVTSLPGIESLQFKAIVRGEALPEVPGRVDDFSWPPRKVEVVLPVVTPEPAVDAIVIPMPVPRPDTDVN